MKMMLYLVPAVLALAGCGGSPVPDLDQVVSIDIAGETDAGIGTPRFAVIERLATSLGGNTGLDVYFPTGEDGERFPAFIYLQGANSDYRSYTTYAARVAAHGFIVAVPNRRTALGLFASLDDVPRVRAQLAGMNSAPDSPLFGLVDDTRYALGGHSFGGAAALDAAGGVCRFPFCGGTFDRSDLAAVIGYGANRCTDDACTDIAIDTSGIAVQLIQGTADTIAPESSARATFEAISGGPRQLVSVLGADHNGHLDLPNPTQPLDLTVSIETAARWTALFLEAFVQADEAALSALTTRPDDNVEQEFSDHTP